MLALFCFCLLESTGDWWHSLIHLHFHSDFRFAELTVFIWKNINTKCKQNIENNWQNCEITRFFCHAMKYRCCVGTSDSVLNYSCKFYWYCRIVPLNGEWNSGQVNTIIQVKLCNLFDCEIDKKRMFFKVKKQSCFKVPKDSIYLSITNESKGEHRVRFKFSSFIASLFRFVRDFHFIPQYHST